jgi:hypothetical protein
MTRKYLIYTCKFPNGQYYVGRTGQTLAKRIWNHKYFSEKAPDKYKVSAAIKHFGFESLVWEIVANTDNYKESFVIEKKYINAFDSINKGYNDIRTDESYRKWARSRTRKIIRSDGVVFDSLVDAAKDLGISCSSISNALKSGKKSCGFGWIYFPEEKPNNQKKEKIVGRKRGNPDQALMNSRRVLCVQTGVIFNTVKAAALFLNKSRAIVIRSCKTGSKISKQYNFQYLKE